MGKPMLFSDLDVLTLVPDRITFRSGFDGDKQNRTFYLLEGLSESTRKPLNKKFCQVEINEKNSQVELPDLEDFLQKYDNQTDNKYPYTQGYINEYQPDEDVWDENYLFSQIQIDSSDFEKLNHSVQLYLNQKDKTFKIFLFVYGLESLFVLDEDVVCINKFLPVVGCKFFVRHETKSI
jgi:hypothetical protein